MHPHPASLRTCRFWWPFKGKHCATAFVDQVETATNDRDQGTQKQIADGRRQVGVKPERFTLIGGPKDKWRGVARAIVVSVL